MNSVVTEKEVKEVPEHLKRNRGRDKNTWIFHINQKRKETKSKKNPPASSFQADESKPESTGELYKMNIQFICT